MTQLSDADMLSVLKRLAFKYYAQEIKQYMRDSLSPVLSQEERRGPRWFMNTPGVQE